MEKEIRNQLKLAMSNESFSREQTRTNFSEPLKALNDTENIMLMAIEMCGWC